MTLKRERCGDCGTMHTVCPDCGDRKVTPYEPTDPDMSPTTSVMDFIRGASRGGSATFEHVCWNCGWTEEWTITVD